MKQHLHLTRIWTTIVLLALMVACNPKAKVSEPAEWLSEKLSAIDSLMWKLSEAGVRVSESLRNERWHSLDGCFRFYNDERLARALDTRHLQAAISIEKRRLDVKGHKNPIQ